jgi:hypothetical protein
VVHVLLQTLIVYKLTITNMAMVSIFEAMSDKFNTDQYCTEVIGFTYIIIKICNILFTISRQ